MKMTHTASGSVRSELDQLQMQIDQTTAELHRLNKLKQEPKNIGYRFEEGDRLLEACAREKYGHMGNLGLDNPDSLMSDQEIMIQFLRKNNVSSGTIDLLLEVECTSMTILRLLTEHDLEDIGVSVGQKRLLQSLLQKEAAAVAGHSGETVTQLGGAVFHGHDPGQLNTDMFLGMGVRGTQKPYLDITDFVSVRSPYDGVAENQTVITAKPDGSYEVKPQAVGKHVTLANVSMPQWMEANTLIMNQLLLQGVAPSAYMSYTVMVCQIAQKYEWVSVLLWDREYRKMQANLGFRWGTDQGHLRDVLLVPKQSKSGFKFGQSGSSVNDQSGKNQKNVNGGQKFQGFSKKKKETGQVKRSVNKESLSGLRLCYYFNEGTCTRVECGFKHWCSLCGSAKHGACDKLCEKVSPKA